MRELIATCVLLGLMLGYVGFRLTEGLKRIEYRNAEYAFITGR